MRRTAFTAWMLGLPLASAGAVAQAATPPGELQRGYAALRAMDCGRCHGGDYKGSSAPSLLAAVREGSRERFDWYVLKGDITRGMPGYESQPFVAAHLDAMYFYLVAAARQRAAHPKGERP